jgi:hypothetical protein
MKKRKEFIVAAFMTVFGIYSFKSTVADVEISFQATHIPYDYYTGNQGDIFRESMYVFNDLITYGNFISTIPSMEGVVPSFDENQETLVFITSKAEPCYVPKVSAVYSQIWLDVEPNTKNILIDIVHEEPTKGDNFVCEPASSLTYIYNIVVMEKTNLPISIRFF